MRNARDILAQRVLLFDGGMGTYYKGRPAWNANRRTSPTPQGSWPSIGNTSRPG